MPISGSDIDHIDKTIYLDSGKPVYVSTIADLIVSIAAPTPNGTIRFERQVEDLPCDYRLTQLRPLTWTGVERFI